MSTMARPKRDSARASGRFSNREIVGREHSSGSESSAILDMAAHRIGVISVFIARRDHQQSKVDDIGERIRDMAGNAGYSMPAAMRSTTRGRPSISRKVKIPPSCPR